MYWRRIQFNYRVNEQALSRRLLCPPLFILSVDDQPLDCLYMENIYVKYPTKRTELLKFP